MTKKEIRRLDKRVQTLARLVKKNADAIELRRAAAPLYLERISRSLRYMDQLDATLGLELIMSDLTPEEFLPRMNTVLRMLTELTTILLSLIDGFLNCFGGTAVIALQILEEWAVGNQDRQESLLITRVYGGKRPFGFSKIAKTAKRKS
jgi:hypothetical protein